MGFRIIKVLIFILLLASQSACSAHRTYQGKLIDADTLKPIEDAVVVAVWRKTKAFLIDSTTDFKDAKETLTDKNGEWSITGPEGQEVPREFDLLFALGLRHITGGPEIIYYKPGYKRRLGSFGSFSAITYIDKKRSLEGIVLIRPGDTREERKKYFKKYDFHEPFVTISNPERKLRNLDFSFKYPENVKKIHIENRYGKIFRYWTYTVIGLKKAKTKEERLRAMNSFSGWGLPIVSNMKREERERLLGPARRKKK